MEYNSIIVSLLREADEVLDCLGCTLRIELEDDITEVGGELDFWIGHTVRVIREQMTEIRKELNTL